MSLRIKKIAKGKTKVQFMRAIGDQIFFVPAGSHLFLCAIFTQAPKKERTLQVNLEGIDARIDIVFVYVGKGMNHLCLRLIIRHNAPRTIARIYGRTILFDEAKSDIQGVLVIDKQATHADTYFSHHALLCSPHAQARAIPSLEINTDDVKAGHAVSAGPLSSDAIIYLRSRGITPACATQLLMRGFVAADSLHISSIEVRKKFERAARTMIRL